MTEVLIDAKYWLLLVLSLAALALEVFALVDAVIRPPDAFRREGKQSKLFWCLLLGFGALVGALGVASPLSMIGLIGITAAGVYLADVRPALRGSRGSSW